MSREVLGNISVNVVSLPQSTGKRTPMTLMKRRQSRQEKRLSIMELIRPWGLLHPEDFKHMVASLSEETKSDILEVITSEPNAPETSTHGNTPLNHNLYDENFQSLGSKLLTVLRESISPSRNLKNVEVTPSSSMRDESVHNVVNFSHAIDAISSELAIDKDLYREDGCVVGSSGPISVTRCPSSEEAHAFAASKKVPRTPPGRPFAENPENLAAVDESTEVQSIASKASAVKFSEAAKEDQTGAVESSEAVSCMGSGVKEGQAGAIESSEAVPSMGSGVKEGQAGAIESTEAVSSMGSGVKEGQAGTIESTEAVPSMGSGVKEGQTGAIESPEAIPSMGSGVSVISAKSEQGVDQERSDHGSHWQHLRERLQAVEQIAYQTQSELATYRSTCRDYQQYRALERIVQSKDLDLLDARIEARRESLKAINTKIELLELKSKLPSTTLMLRDDSKPKASPATLGTEEYLSFGSPELSPTVKVSLTENSNQAVGTPANEPPCLVQNLVSDAKIEGSVNDPIVGLGDVVVSSATTSEDSCGDVGLSSTPPPNTFTGTRDFEDVSQSKNVAPFTVPIHHYESPKSIDCTNDGPVSISGDDVQKEKKSSVSSVSLNTMSGTPMSLTKTDDPVSSSTSRSTKEPLVHGYLRFIPIQAPRLMPSPIGDDYSPVNKGPTVKRTVKRRLFPIAALKEADANAKLSKRVKVSSKIYSPISPKGITEDKPPTRAKERNPQKSQDCSKKPSEKSKNDGSLRPKRNSKETAAKNGRKDRASFDKFYEETFQGMKKDNPKLRKTTVNALLMQMWEERIAEKRQKNTTNDIHQSEPNQKSEDGCSKNDAESGGNGTSKT